MSKAARFSRIDESPERLGLEGAARGACEKREPGSFGCCIP